MKNRFTLIFATLVILLGTMIWLVQDRRATSGAPARDTAPLLPRSTESVVQPEAVAPLSAEPPVQTAALPVKVAATVHVNTAGDLQYIARDGDTVSQLAVALLGSDSREHRDAVIASNPSLRANPDRVLEGYAYVITPPSVADQTRDNSADTRPKAAEDASTDTTTANTAAVASAPKLRYTAQPGDTVGGLASDLLGADTRDNRAAITAGNASLRADPDHLIAGKSYTITAPNGLAADPDAHTKTPTTTPDADDAARISVGRTLRYTARSGDTVSSLAVALLGTDTAANRELITQSNPSLKRDVDHLVAGQTYWISAPTADGAR